MNHCAFIHFEGLQIIAIRQGISDFNINLVHVLFCLDEFSVIIAESAVNINDKIRSSSWNWVFFAIGSAFFAGLTAILGKLGVEGINSNLATFIRTIVVLLVTAGIISARNEWQLPQHIAAKPFTFLILSGVATGLSWLCYYRALQMAPASWVAPIDKLSVVIAIILGVVLLGEPLSMKLVIGSLLILSGVLVLSL